MNRVRHTNPRGFTLIETMMAAALGGVLALACMAMFAAMSRTESATARRFHETASMARLHLVMNRVFGNLLIQSVDGGTAATTPTSGRTTSTSGRNTATAGRNSATNSNLKAPDKARNGEAQAEPRPRVLLEQDRSELVRSAMKAAGLDSSGATPQRLEVVTLRPPVPASVTNITAVELRQALDEAGAMASRGVFELRPDAVTPRERMDPDETLSGDGKGWTLWWRQLPPNIGLLEPDPFAMDPTQDPTSVRVAVGLVQCNWQVFKTIMDPATNKPKGRERVPDLSAMALQDLPAYVEMRATTASGLSANWMFEVGWGYGPETLDEAQQDGSLTADGSGAGADGAGNGANGPGTVATVNGGVQVSGAPIGPGGNPKGAGQGFITVTTPDGQTTTVPAGGGGRDGGSKQGTPIRGSGGSGKKGS